MRNLLAVDLSYQSYRASAAHPHLTYDDEFTGGLFGFFQSLGKMVREAEITDIVIGADSKPYKRSAEFPEYKMIRKANRDDELLERHRTTMRLLERVFHDLGIPIWGVPGFEFDDLAGHLVSKYRHRYDKIIAASNDSDLFQLLGVRNFYVLPQDWSEAWTADRLWKKHELTPEEYMLSTALTGTHNDLPGIAGIGPGKAKAAIRNPGKMRELRAQHGEVIERNLRLISLPHKDFPYDAAIPAVTGEYDSRHLYRVFARYGISVTASMVSIFERILK